MAQKIWGSPVTPWFLGMAFNKRPGKEIKKGWNKIPDNLDILITHGPPGGILDNGIGCEELKIKIETAIPGIHIFGHAHGQNGVEETNSIKYVNAALVNSLNPLEDVSYRLVGRPIILKVSDT
ncbi:MAG: hypothetical protein ABI863_14850 [Ginsengibacter sp.]